MAANRIDRRILTDVELRLECSNQGCDVPLTDLDRHVDVCRGSRFTHDRAGQGATEHVGNLQIVEDSHDAQCDVEGPRRQSATLTLRVPAERVHHQPPLNRQSTEPQRPLARSRSGVPLVNACQGELPGVTAEGLNHLELPGR
jgi:hypothetical protein